MEAAAWVRQLGAVVLAASLASGCTSTTMIRSKPSGAAVYLDDNPKPVGRTPYQINETTWDWTKHKVRLEKEGYLPVDGEVKPHISGARTVGWAVGTFFLILPAIGFLSTVDYPDGFDFTLPADEQWATAKAAKNADEKAKAIEACSGAPGDNPFELKCYELTNDLEHLVRALKVAKSRKEQCAALSPVLTASLHPAEDTAKMGADSILVEECRTARTQAQNLTQAQKQCAIQCKTTYDGCLNTPVQRQILEEHSQGCEDNKRSCEAACSK